MVEVGVTKKRKSNIELLRIVLMLAIIASHYVVSSNLMPVAESSVSAKNFFLLAVSAFGKTCINCFVLITGYFMCKSQLRMKRISKLVLEVIFYYGVIYLVFLCTGVVDCSAKEFIVRLLPTKIVGNDFTSAYVLFMTLIPFINIFVKSINKRQHIAVLCILLFIYTILGNSIIVPVHFNYISWFFVVYLIGAYIRLYPKPYFEDNKIWGCVAALLVIVSMASVLLCLVIHQSYPSMSVYFFVRDCNKILAISTAVAIFMFFKNLKIKYNRVINYFAASTFGVLLIHASGGIMTNWLWNDTLKTRVAYDNIWLFAHFAVSVFGVYLVCVLIDKLRINLLEKPLFEKIEPHIIKMELKIKKLAGFN